MFDRYVVVDWSANSVPKLGRDSIWIAVHDDDGQSVTNVPTRAAAFSFLVDLLEAEPTGSVLLGVDFSLGYPVGTARALGLDGMPWAATWDLLAGMITDDDGNANNRFDVASELNRRITGGPAPFWGCPPIRVGENLTATKPSPTGVLGSWRGVEEVLRSQGRRPFSSWQLLGAGAVGSQSLLGVPRLHRLRARFGDRIEVWPFTTGLTAPAPTVGRVVVAEVWPSMLPVDDTDGAVRDAAQVAGMARWLAEAGREGRLGPLFAPQLTASVVTDVVAEEGWVLGVVA